MVKQWDVGKIHRRVATLQRELGRVGPVMRGSIVVIGTRNKQPPWLQSAVVLLQIALSVAIWHILRSAHPSRVAPASESWLRGRIVDVALHE